MTPEFDSSTYHPLSPFLKSKIGIYTVMFYQHVLLFLSLHGYEGLSKWIRQRLKYQSDFNHSMRLLQTFTESMMVKDDSAQSNDQR